MSAPAFDLLEDKLLKGGIAPRHVKRYLRELNEHLADLIEAQRREGLNADDAALMARTRLGEDEALAQAMIRQRDFRSISARFPWLVFGVMPPLAVVVACFILVPLMIIVGHLGGAISPHNHLVLPVPAWFDWTMTILVFAANFLIGTTLAFLLARMAARQRMKLIWPLAGMALILILGMHGSFHAGSGGISFYLDGFLLSYRASGVPSHQIHWPTFLAQAALLCLPLAWFIRRQRKAETAA